MNNNEHTKKCTILIFITKKVFFGCGLRLAVELNNQRKVLHLVFIDGVFSELLDKGSASFTGVRNYFQSFDEVLSC